VLSLVREESQDDTKSNWYKDPKSYERDNLSDSDEDGEGQEEEDKVDFTQSFGRPMSENPMKNFTFMDGEQMPRNVSKKLNSISSIRDYLESELGEERLWQAYPVLRDFGDDILFEERTPDLVQKLSHIPISKEEVKKYQNFFALLVFHDLQADDSGGGVDGMLSAAATLKGISHMTANFGKF